MRLPAEIPCVEEPPATEKEWQEALREYGLDREDDLDVAPSSYHPYLTTDCAGPSTYIPASRPLIHRADSDDALKDDTPSTQSGGKPSRGPSKSPSSSQSIFGGRSERCSFDSTTSAGTGARDDVGNGDLGGGIFPIDGGVGRIPLSSCPIQEDEEEESWSAQSERTRIKEHYKQHGWLCGPQPTAALNNMRRNTLRRLGLSGTSRGAQQEAIMSKYADLAALVLGTSKGAVSVTSGDYEVYQTSTDIVRITPDEALCSHAVIHMHEQCTVVADLDRDWRFKNSRQLPGYKFYAAAPLRYYRDKGRPVDVGTLCVFDQNARTHFDAKSQEILLKMANMLVYQLATLQSENLARHARKMFETNTAFLRRAVLTAPKSDTMPKKKSRVAPLPPAKPHLSHHTSYKSGPKEARNAKNRADSSNDVIFQDAADTLKKMLGCDSVTVVALDDYQLFIRKTTANVKDRKLDRDKVVANYMEGQKWPSEVEPVVLYTPSSSPTPRILGSAGQDAHHFDRPGSGEKLRQIIPHYLKARQFWWQRDDDDDLTAKFMTLVPDQAQTSIMAAMISPNGTLWMGIFASWNQPSQDLADSSRLAVPFAWHLGASVMAAMSIRKVRSIEQSQISYSNIQAHELRTPLHQILAITQLLRSSMNDLADSPHQPSNSLTTMQQVRDLLPFLDAIDTSGKTLAGIVDNILTFLDLKAKENSLVPRPPGVLTMSSGSAQSLEVMFEELIREACEEDKRVRSAKGLPQSNIETIFEIIPPLLGEEVTEDSGGALRRAISKILSNAYKFIDSQGCVEIYVDDIPCMMPPEGCEDISLTRKISIIIVDSGRGMEDDFVRDKLGEPWTKEDPYATGSGLSVHLAWRIIDLMGGSMNISSSPGKGCTVKLEVPVPRRAISTPNSPDTGKELGSDDPTRLAVNADDIQMKRKVALYGYTQQDASTHGLPLLKSALERQFAKLGCEIVDIEEADLVIMDGRTEERPINDKLSLGHNLDRIKANDVVVLVAADHEADSETVAKEEESRKEIRRFRKPTTPSILREILFPKHASDVRGESAGPGSTMEPINTPDHIDEHGQVIVNKDHSKAKNKGRAHFDDSAQKSNGDSTGSSTGSWLSSFWKPKNMDVEEAVASLCLGDYFSSRRKATPSSSSATSTAHMGSSGFSERSGATSSTGSTPAAEDDGENDTASLVPSSVVTLEDEAQPEPEPESEPENIKVMVVEDNVINRRILVKILSSKLNVEICEAEDGAVAVEQFRSMTTPVIVLLDINMPVMDGYQAATEMRAIEKARAAANKSGKPQRASIIIAVTALASEDEKRRGLVECGIDEWISKPFSKAMITKRVDQARKELEG